MYMPRLLIAGLISLVTVGCASPMSKLSDAALCQQVQSPANLMVAWEHKEEVVRRKLDCNALATKPDAPQAK